MEHVTVLLPALAISEACDALPGAGPTTVAAPGGSMKQYNGQYLAEGGKSVFHFIGKQEVNLLMGDVEYRMAHARSANRVETGGTITAAELRKVNVLTVADLSKLCQQSVLCGRNWGMYSAREATDCGKFLSNLAAVADTASAELDVLGGPARQEMFIKFMLRVDAFMRYMYKNRIPWGNDGGKGHEIRFLAFVAWWVQEVAKISADPASAATEPFVTYKGLHKYLADCWLVERDHKQRKAELTHAAKFCHGKYIGKAQPQYQQHNDDHHGRGPPRNQGQDKSPGVKRKHEQNC